MIFRFTTGVQAGPTGFEPAASSLTGKRSDRLELRSQGSGGWYRTSTFPINSRKLCQLSYARLQVMATGSVLRICRSLAPVFRNARIGAGSVWEYNAQRNPCSAGLIPDTVAGTGLEPACSWL